MEDFRQKRLILLSGMAADASVFAPQRVVFPWLEVPRWPVPGRRETLAAYAERLAACVGRTGPCVIGGASFGGIVALEMARFLDPPAVILIGSVRGPHEIPLWVKSCRPLAGIVPWLPTVGMQSLLSPLATNAVCRRWQVGGIIRQFCRCDHRVLRWSVQQLLTWQESPAVDCPVYHIHGQRDFILPAKHTQPDKVVARGGHVISLTHAEEVNSFIRCVLDRVE